jgi:hypothetical protein
MPNSNHLKWRFVRTRTSEGEKYYWELVAQDGTVKDRIAADITLPQPPVPGSKGDKEGSSEQA